MPHQARIDGAGTLHHMICRGIERKEIFTDDLDRDDFVSRLEAILVQTSTRCYAEGNKAPGYLLILGNQVVERDQ